MSEGVTIAWKRHVPMTPSSLHSVRLNSDKSRTTTSFSLHYPVTRGRTNVHSRGKTPPTSIPRPPVDGDRESPNLLSPNRLVPY